MGIEPTCDTVYESHNGFEDRGRHQAGLYFQAFPFIESCAANLPTASVSRAQSRGASGLGAFRSLATQASIGTIERRSEL